MTSDHDPACLCRFCARLKDRTMTTPDWMARHATHGETFGSAPFEHPSGRWYWLVCQCGARHLCFKDGDE